MHAVILESDESIRTLLTLALQREGLDVATASTLQDVFSMAPLIIFIDRSHLLCTVENLQTLHDATMPAPYIVVMDTMHGFLPGLQEEADVWLTKPFTGKQIQQVLSAAIS